MKSQLLNEFAGVHGELGSAPPNCVRINPLLPGEKERRQERQLKGAKGEQGEGEKRGYYIEFAQEFAYITRAETRLRQRRQERPDKWLSLSSWNLRIIQLIYSLNYVGLCWIHRLLHGQEKWVEHRFSANIGRNPAYYLHLIENDALPGELLLDAVAPRSPFP